MNIDTLEIKNFKRIKQAKFEKLSNINILLGENNCGKTSVLEAIDLSLSVGERKRYRSELNKLNRRRFDTRYLFHQHDYQNTISIALNEEEKEKALTVTLLNFDPSSLEFTKIERSMDSLDGPIRLSRLARSSVYEDDKLTVIAKVSYQQKEPSKDGYIFYGVEGQMVIHRQNELAFNVKSLFLSTNKDEDVEEESLEGAQELKQNRADGGITEVFQQIEPKVQGWEFGMGNDILIDIDGEQERRHIDYMGDGFNRVFAILTSLHRCKGGVLLVDEIENGLHYKTIKQMLTTLHAYVSLNPDTQLFVTSHSKDLLTSLNEFMKEEATAKDHFSVYRIKRRRREHHQSISYRSPSPRQLYLNR